jgi:hypothetical protein
MSRYANLGALSIMYVVMNKRAEVIALLVKNGVKVPNNASDMQLALLVTNLLKISKAFSRDFNQLVTQNEVVSGIFSGFDGSYSYVNNYFGNLPTFNPNLFSSPATPTTTPAVTTQTTAQDTKSKGNFWGNALGVLQTGFTGFLALDENKTKRALADASVQIKQSDVSLAEKGILPAGNTLPKTGLSTGAIVGLSVLGIAVVGGVIYFAMKNKTQ